jgi:hypothetical protein
LSPVGATSVDDLIASAAKSAAAAAHAGVDKSAAGTPTGADKKNSKKDKSKGGRLVYTDNDFSPEAKKANSQRYAFTPSRSHATTA